MRDGRGESRGDSRPENIATLCPSTCSVVSHKELHVQVSRSDGLKVCGLYTHNFKNT